MWRSRGNVIPIWFKNGISKFIPIYKYTMDVEVDNEKGKGA